ncbi:MAG: prepilin-type N-terminal cleavage/methylation domain-containing protein [Verrucomicrobiales bacterium]|nr:prepilin-type N-terminal cleavage/methylation domain-containing protein [Verrucomicrobiales bacterium]
MNPRLSVAFDCSSALVAGPGPAFRAGRSPAAGFTLIEILVATLAFSVLLVALHSVFFSALEMRREGELRIQEVQAAQQVAQLIERDLRNGVLTGGALGESLLGETETEGRGRADRIELITSTGTITDDQPYGDLQRVEYYLTRDSRWTNTAGMALARGVTRNLLADVEEEPEPQILLRDVESFEISYYDGSSWADSWDTTQNENTPPTAIRLAVLFVDDLARDWRRRPFELVVPWSVQPMLSSTNETDTATGEGDEDTPPDDDGGAGGGGGGQPPGGGGGGGGQLPPGGGAA